MLTRLDQIDGVASSATNESGTLIRLTLRPGAEPGKVTRKVRRVLSEQVADRVPVPIRDGAAAAALRWEKWRDKSQVAASVGTKMHISADRRSGRLAALLLGCAAIALGFLGWRQRRTLTGKERDLRSVCSPL